MFTADAVDRLAGPGWLQDRRRAAWARFEGASLPSSEEEVWRYSRIAELDLEEWEPLVEPAAAGVPTDVTDVVAGTADAGGRAALVVVQGGRITHAEVDPQLAAAGLAVGPLTELGDADDLGCVAADAADAFGHLHDAFLADPVLVRVPDGLDVSAPVVVVHWDSDEGTAAFPHLVVRAGEGSSVAVLEHQASSGARLLTVPVVELDAAAGSTLRYVAAQHLGTSTWQLGRQVSRAADDARLELAVVALGGDYARQRIDSTLAGRGSTAELSAVYFGEGSQMHDLRTLQDHVAPATRSELLFKGAVQDRSRSVYTGLIHIGKQASGVDAFQTNRNITLSEGAWAESVPNLEIENNDVRCSHASAVGPVDEDQLFYLESRGVPTQVAERLIVLGFFDEVLQQLPVAAAAGPARRAVAAKLARRESADG